MHRRSVLVAASVALLASACGQPDGPASVTAPAPVIAPAPSEASRIVSLDYCADQYVVTLAERERILRVSSHATAPYSWAREAARGLPTVRPRAEDVLLLQPDLVVRSFGGGPKAADFLERAGVPVLQVPWIGSIEDARRALLELSHALGNPQRGAALLRDMDARLDRIVPRDDAREVLYLTPAGVSAGPGTLIDEIIRSAGLKNFQRRAGWHSIPLERLAYERPQVVALAFFDRHRHVNTWSPATHPVAQRQLEGLPAVRLDSAWVACGGWFLVEAVEALAGAGVGVPVSHADGAT